jgi:caa(3)-type oxidase subunit IV
MAHAHAHDHGNTVKEYMKVFWTLCALTILTVVAAKLHFPQSWETPGDILHVTIGVVIAVIKVIAVMYIFMHLKFDNPFIRAFVFVPTFLFFVLIFALNFLETWDYTYPTILP